MACHQLISVWAAAAPDSNVASAAASTPVATPLRCSLNNMEASLPIPSLSSSRSLSASDDGFATSLDYHRRPRRRTFSQKGNLGEKESLAGKKGIWERTR